MAGRDPLAPPVTDPESIDAPPAVTPRRRRVRMGELVNRLGGQATAKPQALDVAKVAAQRERVTRRT